MVKEDDFFFGDVEWCVHILAEDEDFTSVEWTIVLEFFAVKDSSKEPVTC